jgi:endo-1,4-beta-xylanase
VPRVDTRWAGARPLALGLVTFAPLSAAAPHPAPIGARAAVPLGSALWYACTDPGYAGPAPLRCLVSAFDSRYASTFTQNFDRLTPENEFKMVWTQPAQGKFDFSVTDKIVQFAAENAKQIRGHTLVYAARQSRLGRQPTAFRAAVDAREPPRLSDGSYPVCRAAQ